MDINRYEHKYIWTKTDRDINPFGYKPIQTLTLVSIDLANMDINN
jgi:hypothetical protein